MDESKRDLSEPENESKLDDQPEPEIESKQADQPEPEIEFRPDDQPEPQLEAQAVPEMESEPYLNERIQHAIDRVKAWSKDAKDYYLRSPRLQNTTYQGKFLPAFWTVTAIFSLLVNVILIALLISFGHHFFELKAHLTDGVVNGLSENLSLMDKAHIVTTVPFETTVQLQDTLPVVFDLPINQNTQLSLIQDTRISGAMIYLNNTAVTTDLTLPAKTPIQVNFNMTVPVSQSVPVDFTIPVSMLVPVDVAIDQTDLHQSIVGMQSAIEPYKVLASDFNSPEDFPLCNQWWSGWMCNVFFGKP